MYHSKFKNNEWVSIPECAELRVNVISSIRMSCYFTIQSGNNGDGDGDSKKRQRFKWKIAIKCVCIRINWCYWKQVVFTWEFFSLELLNMNKYIISIHLHVHSSEMRQSMTRDHQLFSFSFNRCEGENWIEKNACSTVWVNCNKMTNFFLVKFNLKLL